MPTGHLCLHAPSEQGPPAPSAGGKVHRGQRSSCVIGSEDLWEGGPGTGLGVSWGDSSSPSSQGGRQGPGSPATSLKAREESKLPGLSQHRWLCLSFVSVPSLPPGPCPSQAPPHPAAGPGLTCRPSWSQSPCLLRGPSSSRGKGQSVGEGELRAQTPEPGGLGLNPSSVTSLKWPGLSEPQFPSL